MLSAVILLVLFQALFSSIMSIAAASDYGSMSPEQRFDGVTKKYESMDEARVEVEGMLGGLGDRYTRYLPPPKYDSMVNAATGNLYGMGVELAPKDNEVIVSDVDPGAMDFILMREPIKITSVRGHIGKKVGMTGKVGVVRIKNSLGTTSDAIRVEIGGLKKWGATNFVLDLRGIPSGLLPGSSSRQTGWWCTL
ncbi:hypothetical protein ACHAW5_010524 [Stephanodiscus triporus]|uniref:PDZ domain-containing protein n=1 Tax=Stephanodiscus triporus TaxID=2934178 RepID=A0ABD3NYB5_9STRA